MKLVLVGGGHSHALVIKMWAAKPITNIDLVLISPQRYTPYSGMLPGLIAGDYSFSDTHIDLQTLCLATGVTFICDRVNKIDANQKLIHCNDQSDIGFDLLSINTGITPDLSTAGAQEFTIPVKPIADFYPKWLKLIDQLQISQMKTNIYIIGGGAAGAELALAVKQKLERLNLTNSTQVHLLYRNSAVPSSYPEKLQRKLATILQTKNIVMHPNSDVCAITSNHIKIKDNNADLPYDVIFWCANAQASDWLTNCNFNLSNGGFIAVNAELQSTSHEYIFAAGDIASQENQQYPKAGVFAVRQAPILFENLQNFILSKKLKPYKPQNTFLSILTCGDHYALGARINSSLPSISGKWVWRWKDRIDRKFMDQLKF
jgi:selenide,water dikinase